MIFVTEGLELVDRIFKTNLLGDLENNGSGLVLFVSTLLGTLPLIVTVLLTILTRSAS